MGLRQGDLKDMMDNIFEIDSFSSKMGDDKDIVTLSFSLKENSAAKDLMNFLERGYGFILDADVTSGEQSDGTYKVFVELAREKNVHENILEIIDGVKSLSEMDDFKFRYYKNWRSQDLSQDALEEFVPNNPDNYGIKVEEARMENYKEFFNKGFIDTVDLKENILRLKKVYADPLAFEFIDFGDVNYIRDNINGKFDIMESYPEILFLTKYIGDYNISKYGDKLVFENQDKALVLKRI
tara:strand:+ start:810 stop:1526 length:717 start_codon:yes stop_codon:yes gene_type:complete